MTTFGRTMALGLWMVAALAVHAAPVEPPAADPGVPYELEQNVRVELGVTLAGGVLYLLSESALKTTFAQQTCTWCDRTLNPLDAWGRGVRSPEKLQGRPDAVSSAVAYGVIPLGLAGMEWLMVSRAQGGRAWVRDTLDIAEAVIAAGLINEVVKDAAGRQRPFVRVLLPASRVLVDNAADNNTSFFSGHTSLAFSLVAATATVAELRGYRESYWIWAAGLPAAAAVGVLRMAADKHYFTDVLVGAAVGTAVGVGLPRLAHPRKLGRNLTWKLSAGVGGAALTGSF